MADEKKESRIKMEDLPKPEQELSSAEAKNVQGGSRYAFGSIDRAQQEGAAEAELADEETRMKGDLQMQ